MSGVSFMERLLDGVEVEWKPLGETCKVFSGCAFESKLFNTAGEGLPLIRIRDVNTGFSETYYSGEYHDRYLVDDGDILIGMDGDFRVVRWKHGRALLNQRVCRLQEFDSQILPGFMYYLVQDELDRIHSKIQGSTVKHLSSKELALASIPIPPLEIQAEIVRILDAFISMTAELTAELNLRRQQYNYYRDLLLSEAELSKVGFEWKTLAEVGEFVRGNGLPKADFTEFGVPAIHYGQIYTYYGLATKKTLSFVSEKTAEKLKKVETGDVIITNTSENLEDVGKALVYLGEKDAVTGGHATIFKPSNQILGKYFAYFTQTNLFFIQKRKYAKGTKVIDVSATDLKKIKIPIPSLAEQARIVAILDKFDTLTTSLTEGLPREIELRQKQYEYYRDLLLRFPKPDAEEVA